MIIYPLQFCGLYWP